MNKILYTIWSKSGLINPFYAGSIALILIFCSFESLSQQDKTAKQKDKQTLSFSEEEDGIKTRYEVNFEDGKILSIYKDGNKIPDDEIDNYNELVYDKLNYLRKDYFDLSMYPPQPFTFHFDMDEFQNEMKEMRKKFKDEKFKFEFDRKKFKEDMEKLKENLKDYDNIVVHIDKDQIKKNLDESLKRLDELKIHKFHFDFDNDEIELSMNNLEKEMEHLEDEMDDLSKEMKKLDKDMKILDKFLDAIKDELVKDGLISNKDAISELEFSSTEMKVNGKKIPEDLFNKYKKIYKEHYNKEPDDKMKIRIN